MRIRTQTILGITPIFTLLGVAISLLVYTTERAEVIWGIEEEVAALAISIAEFLGEDRPTGGVDDLGVAPASERIDAILGFGQLKRARFFQLEESGRKLLWDRGNEDYDPIREPGNSESRAVLGRGIWLNPTDTSKTGLAIARAMTPVKNGKGEFHGLLEVITDAGRLETRTKRIMWRCVNITAVLTITGVFLSLGISSFLTRRLRRLDRAARVVAQGDYDQKIDLRSIREVNDLGSTFNTMSSIIRDTITKAKTRLVESDQFRNPADLAETCRALSQKNRRIRAGDHEWLVGLAGNISTGSFAALEEKDGTIHGVIGAVIEDDPFEASVKAGAALAYLVRLLADDRSPQETLELAGEVFDFSSCRILKRVEGNPTECWDGSGDSIDRKILDLDREMPVVFTTGSAESTQKLRRIIQSSGTATHPDLEVLLAGEKICAYLIVQTGKD